MQAAVEILVQDLAKILKVIVRVAQQRLHPQPVNKQALAQLVMQILVTAEQAAVMITEMAHTTAEATVAAPVLPVQAVMKNKLNLFQKKIKIQNGWKMYYS